jgi:hypothetical protein
MANPRARKAMNFYPHINYNKASQTWHGDKMISKAPDSVMTPMIRYCGKTYYVNELVRRERDWFLPLRWVLIGEAQEQWCIGYHVEETEVGPCTCLSICLT